MTTIHDTACSQEIRVPLSLEALPECPACRDLVVQFFLTHALDCAQIEFNRVLFGTDSLEDWTTNLRPARIKRKGKR